MATKWNVFIWNLLSSGVLRNVDWLLVIEVPGQSYQSLEDGADRFSRNVSNYPRKYAV
jgi:hypothetical protein